MLKIRLKRTGKKNAPSYRIVVADSRSPRDGKAKEVIGWYNPSEDPENVSLKRERLDYWVEKGAQTTEAVKNLAEGTYEYEPYTRQNEKGKEKELTNEGIKEETNKEGEEKEEEEEETGN